MDYFLLLTMLNILNLQLYFILVFCFIYFALIGFYIFSANKII